MGLWKLDLMAREQCFQIFLCGLLRMKGDDVPERILRDESLNGAEIQVAFLNHSDTSRRISSSGRFIEHSAIPVRRVGDSTDDVLG